MRSIIDHIKWIMILSGVLTCTMVYAAIAPQAALSSTFGESISGPIAEIVVRNWGALITLVGLMLIYGAFALPNRRMVLIVAGVSKVIFIGLVLVYGRQFLHHQVGIAVGFDTVMVALYAAYLLGTRRERAL